ncbi:hypothetical protein ACFPM0_31115 [Pseudonocardia sulfidoxydans]|uniref:hypothetical protein n=1 Tax=Pseudonocardia sulfidoxydans TaxID=54011 RepID=UPI0036078B70
MSGNSRYRDYCRSQPLTWGNDPGNSERRGPGSDERVRGAVGREGGMSPAGLRSGPYRG